MPPRRRRPQKYRSLADIYASTEEITLISSDHSDDQNVSDDIEMAASTEESTTALLQDSSPSSPRDDSICFTVTLSPDDVAHNFLVLEKAKFIKLMPDPEMITNYPENDNKVYQDEVGEPITVYDDALDAEYKMQLTAACYCITPLFSITTDWDKFVRAHEAKSGDVVTFLRNTDEENNGYRYVIRITKMVREDVSDTEATATENSTALQDLRPSSPLDDSICFTVTLGPNDVAQNFLVLEKAKFIKLMPNPEMITQFVENKLYQDKVGEPITVYDDALNTEYRMQLTAACYCITPMFSITTHWDEFVRAHKAKSGDIVTFFRSRDEENNGYRYVISISKVVEEEKRDDDVTNAE